MRSQAPCPCGITQNDTRGCVGQCPEVVVGRHCAKSSTTTSSISSRTSSSALIFVPSGMSRLHESSQRDRRVEVRTAASRGWPRGNRFSFADRYVYRTPDPANERRKRGLERPLLRLRARSCLGRARSTSSSRRERIFLRARWDSGDLPGRAASRPAMQGVHGRHQRLWRRTRRNRGTRSRPSSLLLAGFRSSTDARLLPLCCGGSAGWDACRRDRTSRTSRCAPHPAPTRGRQVRSIVLTSSLSSKHNPQRP